MACWARRQQQQERIKLLCYFSLIYFNLFFTVYVFKETTHTHIQTKKLTHTHTHTNKIYYNLTRESATRRRRRHQVEGRPEGGERGSMREYSIDPYDISYESIL